MTNLAPHSVTTRQFDGHYWNGEWCDQRTYITDGYALFVVRGEQAGADLYIFLGGSFIDLPDGVTDHAGAVAWCERQFTRKAVSL